MKSRTISRTVAGPLVSIEEAGRVAGVSRRTFYRMVESGRLSEPVICVEPRPVLRVDLLELLGHLEAERRSTTDKRKGSTNGF